jgi:hypothetical protein
VLELSNFPLKSSSKYHVLAGCDEYIKQLKQKKKSLDLEAKLRYASPVHLSFFSIETGNDRSRPDGG